MKYYMGMDHGTTAISFQIIDENKKDVAYFKLNRDEVSNNKVNFKDTLREHVNIADINLLAMTYAMGDSINKITPLEKVKDRGILSINGAGKVTGGGSKIYEEILSLKIPSILIPGLHKDCEFMDERFRASYSHCASSEKVSLTYYAYTMTGWKNMIIADISSNTVCILVEDGIIKGALDACIGAMGFIHGPLDLSMIREIDEGKKTANECFSHAGAIKIAGVDGKVANMKDQLLENYKNGDKKARLAIDTLIMTVAMEIAGLDVVCENDIEGIVLTGSIGSATEPFNFENEINKYFKNKYELKVISKESGAIGAAQIAQAVYDGEDNILGIDVDF